MAVGNIIYSTSSTTIASGDIINATDFERSTNLQVDTVSGNLNITGGINTGSVSNLGSNSNVKISGGSNGQVLRTDGSSNLSWTTPTSGGQASQIFFSSDLFYIPIGVTGLKVTVVGGGGGSRSSGSTNGLAGSSIVESGSQIISGQIIGYGGGGGTQTANGTPGGALGQLAIAGEQGLLVAELNANNTGSGARPGNGGKSFLSTPNVPPSLSVSQTPVNGSGYGQGATGGIRLISICCGNQAFFGSFGGAGGGTAISWLSGLTPGATLTVTVGAGGAAGTGGAAGASGVVIFEW